MECQFLFIFVLSGSFNEEKENIIFTLAIHIKKGSGKSAKTFKLHYLKMDNLNYLYRSLTVINKARSASTRSGCSKLCIRSLTSIESCPSWPPSFSRIKSSGTG